MANSTQYLDTTKAVSGTAKEQYDANENAADVQDILLMTPLIKCYYFGSLQICEDVGFL
jgi:hypothetical protein